jgi:hypothetical protein
MTLPWRGPLVSLTALTSYLLVNLGAAALHHHHGVEIRVSSSAVSASTACFQAIDEQDDDDQEHCVLCSVLHLAQSLPATYQSECLCRLAGEAISLVPAIHPHLLESATHARAPPLM